MYFSLYFLGSQYGAGSSVGSFGNKLFSCFLTNEKVCWFGSGFFVFATVAEREVKWSWMPPGFPQVSPGFLQVSPIGVSQACAATVLAFGRGLGVVDLPRLFFLRGCSSPLGPPGFSGGFAVSSVFARFAAGASGVPSDVRPAGDEVRRCA